MTTTSSGFSLREDRANVLLALAVAFVELVGTAIWVGATDAPRGLDIISVLLLLATSLPLTVRDRYPLAVLVVVAVASSVYAWIGATGPLYWLGMVFAIWGAVAAGHRLAALLAGAAFLVSFLLAAGFVEAGHAGDPDAPIWLAGWLVASFVLGEVSRSRRQYLEQLEQRALDAERTREEEARRRAGEERLRIARELHDVLAHNISLINVQAGVAVHLLDKQPEQARTALVTISQASKEALRELRATLGVLRQVDEDEPRTPVPGLVGLPELLERAESAGITVDVTTSGEPRSLNGATDLAAYRIIQESLTNVARHSGSQQATVAIEYGSDDVVISIDDHGARLPVEPLTIGNGLTGMRERASAVGGELRAGPRPDGGFRVWARLPIGERT